MSHKSDRAKRGVGSTGVLCRSLSRKLLSRSFWRKAAAVREEGSQGVLRRRTSFGELIMLDQEHRKATSFNEYAALAAPSFTTSSGCGSNSWGESEFTFASTVASSESSNENYLLLEATKECAPRRHKVEEEVVTKVTIISNFHSFPYLFFKFFYIVHHSEKENCSNFIK